MKEVIAVINQKGGVGKSTTAFALGAGLSLKGHKVLFVDLDAQGNLSDTLRAKDGSLSVMDLLAGLATAAEATWRGDRWDIIPSSPALAGADISISGNRKEYRLKEAIAPVKEEYSYIVIDTPPALGVLMTNALAACSWAIIPAQADRYSLKGIVRLHSTIDIVKKHSNPALEVKGILLTRHNTRAVLSRDIAEVIEQTAERLRTRLFKTAIRENVAIREAQARQQDIYSYAPKSNAALDYGAFVDELLEGTPRTTGKGDTNP
jgi:chromosome partitioning protein